MGSKDVTRGAEKALQKRVICWQNDKDRTTILCPEPYAQEKQAGKVTNCDECMNGG